MTEESMNLPYISLNQTHWYLFVFDKESPIGNVCLAFAEDLNLIKDLNKIFHNLSYKSIKSIPYPNDLAIIEADYSFIETDMNSPFYNRDSAFIFFLIHGDFYKGIVQYDILGNPYLECKQIGYIEMLKTPSIHRDLVIFNNYLNPNKNEETSASNQKS